MNLSCGITVPHFFPLLANYVRTNTHIDMVVITNSKSPHMPLKTDIRSTIIRKNPTGLAIFKIFLQYFRNETGSADFFCTVKIVEQRNSDVSLKAALVLHTNRVRSEYLAGSCSFPSRHKARKHEM